MTGFDKNNDLMVRHRFTGEAVVIPKSKLPPFKVITDIFVDNNWSEKDLCLSSKLDKDGTKAHLISNYFSAHVSGQKVVSPEVIEEESQPAVQKQDVAPVKQDSFKYML